MKLLYKMGKYIMKLLYKRNEKFVIIVNEWKILETKLRNYLEKFSKNVNTKNLENILINKIY